METQTYGQLVEALQAALKAVGQTPEIRTEERDADVYQGAQTVICDAFHVYPKFVEVEYDTIAGKRKRQEWHWQVDQQVVIPGVHSFRNGDPGWLRQTPSAEGSYPDDVDYVEIGHYRTCYEVAATIARLVAQDAINGALEAIAEARLQGELEQYFEEVL